jgi:hypothetical protein
MSAVARATTAIFRIIMLKKSTKGEATQRGCGSGVGTRRAVGACDGGMSGRGPIGAFGLAVGRLRAQPNRFSGSIRRGVRLCDCSHNLFKFLVIRPPGNPMMVRLLAYRKLSAANS